MQYQQLEPAETFFQKFYRYLYPIVSISLLNYTMSNTYSLMVNYQEVTGFISIIISSLTCFFLSQSHLTIYGISVLSIVYFSMLGYSEQEKAVMTFLAGVIHLVLWRVLHTFRDIYHYLPGKVHSGMILGIGCIVLAKFFPLAIENVDSFYNRHETFFESPLPVLRQLFKEFNLLTLILTAILTILIFFMRRKLARFPSILIFVLIGVLVNFTGTFKSYNDLCEYKSNGITVNCNFYIIDLNKITIPRLQQLFYLIPASLVLAMILIFEQFITIEEFERRGRKYKGEGGLGDIEKESKVLCISNIVCGLFGGLPVCINLFTTYENFSFTKKYGFRGTKVVGVSQIFFNYLLYSILNPVYMMIPLFIIFCIIVIPLVYFFKTVYRYSFKDMKIVLSLALLNVVTHPIFALIVGAFFSIYEMAQQLNPAPAEILIGGYNELTVRDSTTFERLQEQKTGEEVLAKVVAIDDDIPNVPPQENFVLYRFTGAITYLNFYIHHDEIMQVIQKRGGDNHNGGSRELYDNIIFSFRYVQNIDSEALESLSHLVRQIKESNRKNKVLITGLHSTLLTKLTQSSYFQRMIEEEEQVFYRLHGKNIE